MGGWHSFRLRFPANGVQDFVGSLRGCRPVVAVVPCSCQGVEWPHEQVAGVGVGMHEVRDEHLPQIGAIEAAGHFLATDAGGIERCTVRDLDRGDVLHGQYAWAGIVPVYPGDDDARVVGEVPGEAFGILAFSGEVQLGTRGTCELLEQAIQVNPLADG